MTYNIRGALGMDGMRSIRRIAEVLQQIDADVICLQEVHKWLPWSQFKDQPGVLSRLLGKQAVFQSNYRVGLGGFGNLILTSLHIVSHASHVLPNENERRSILRKPEKRGLLAADLLTKEGTVKIMTTHWSLDPADRLASAMVVGDLINSEDTSVILCGDFNAISDSIEMKELEKLTGLHDVATAIPQPTFTSDRPAERIDYIWVSSALEVEQVNVGTSLASDHLPLEAQLGRLH